MKRFICVSASVLLLAACGTATPPKYDWGTYEQSMYGYYKSPEKTDQLIESLAATIIKAETGKQKVAPGLYAEYGYLLMKQGRQQDAIANFDKEKTMWPESTVLMDRMSKLAQAKPAQGEVKQ